jgi:hypothetical protein|tara:strand:+ start:88 stop:333 length:246 start_codon:yes stop_codon:yes gene_type:complete
MNFSHRYLSIHRPGKPIPILEQGQIGVWYDGTTHVYDVEDYELEDFTAWAVSTWTDIHGDENVTEDPCFNSSRRILCVESF